MQTTHEDEASAHLSALRSHLESMRSLCESITAFTASHSIDSYKPPIIDRSTTYADNSIGGLAKFETLCSKELDHHLYLLRSRLPLDSFSSNAPFLTAVWREVMISPKPVIEISPQVLIPNRRPFKFDVISANGNQWHKINTITKQRLLSEILEMESSDDDSSTSYQPDRWSYVSIVRQCVDMREASIDNPVCRDGRTRLVLRLTRLCEGEQDPRIQSVYRHLRMLGIDVMFGDPAESGTQRIAQPKTTSDRASVPSADLNLDLSMLVALISDISHSPLPETPKDAEARFQPVRRVWKRKTSRIDGHVLEDRAAQKEELGPEEHSRALIVQLQQEMQSALIPELIGTINSACDDHRLSSMEVRFWTTREAMQRCLTIATKIAGPRELERAYLLFKNPIGSSGTKTFWSGSRHRVLDGPLKALHVRIIEDEPNLAKQQSSPHSFAARLGSACQMVVEEEGIVPPHSALPHHFRGTRPTKGQTAGNPPKKPSLHTIRSMLAGATHGMTTITANRTSVKQMVRIMGLRGLTNEDDYAAFLVTEPKTLAEQKRTDGKGYPPVASIWAFEPRSLAESMITNGNSDGDQHASS